MTVYRCPFGYYSDLVQFEKSVKGSDFHYAYCRDFRGTKGRLYRHLADDHQDSILPILLVQTLNCQVQEPAK